jgi:hypothetical protein
VVADVVGRADVWAALHGPLVAGYALDAVEHLGGHRVPGRGAALRAGAQAVAPASMSKSTAAELDPGARAGTSREASRKLRKDPR